MLVATPGLRREAIPIRWDTLPPIGMGPQDFLPCAPFAILEMMRSVAMADHARESEKALERFNTLFDRAATWGVFLVVVLVATLVIKGLAG